MPAAPGDNATSQQCESQTAATHSDAHDASAQNGAPRKPPMIRLYVTGFGKFQGVPTNPTTVLVGALENYLKSTNPLEPEIRDRIEGLTCDVLETSAEGSLEVLSKRFHEKSEHAGVRWIWLHFGVHGGAKSFLLEQQAYNNATFRCPDERGYAPDMLPICDADGDVNSIRRTALPLDQICSRLKAGGQIVELSDDPGRFVCNWCYFNSLQLNQDLETDSLFVHVPPFDVIDETKQLEFARALIQELVQCVCADCDAADKGRERRALAKQAVRSGASVADHLAGEWVGASA